MIKTALVSLAIATTMAASPAAQADTSWDKVASALGKSGTVTAGEVYRVGMLPCRRRDAPLRIQGRHKRRAPRNH
jgi:surface antigen